MAGTYVYGILPADAADAVATAGLDDQPVRGLVHRDVAALVSDAPDDLVGRRRELMRHAAVLEDAVERTAVVPLRFGTVLPSDTAVVADVLRARHDELAALLEEVRGRVEVRLRVHYTDEDAVLAEVVAEQPALQTAGATLDERIRVGERVARGLAAKRQADAQRILARLEPLALDVVPSEPSTDMMVLNTAFLLRQDTLDDFDAAVSDVGADVADRMTMRYVGPMPPASFVDLDLRG